MSRTLDSFIPALVKNLINRLPGLKPEPPVVPEELKDLLRKMASTKAIILNHLQLHMICQAFGLRMEHYSYFEGKMPVDKIFGMHKLSGEWKMVKILAWKAFQSKKLIQRTLNDREIISTAEWSIVSEMMYRYSAIYVPAIFVLAPAKMFSTKVRKLGGQSVSLVAADDPIVVERVDQDHFRVLTSWNVPPSVAVYLAERPAVLN